MNIKQKQLGHFAKIKYSSIPFPENSAEDRARVAMSYLLKNGYAVMSGHAINEILNLIRCMRELRLEFTVKSIDTGATKDNHVFYYEFTLGYFEDDRDIPTATAPFPNDDRNPPKVDVGNRHG